MIQNNWRWCHKCQGLYFAGNPSQGVCPADRLTHENQWSGNYSLVQSPTGAPIGQDNWRWCHKCQGLYFAGNPSQGVCPADRLAHENQGSGNYSLVQNDLVADWQHDWRWCHKCQGLYFAGNPSQGVCPADRLAHENHWSGDYSLAQNLEVAGLLLARGPFMNPNPEFGPTAVVTNGSDWSGKTFMTVSAPEDIPVELSSSAMQNVSPPSQIQVSGRQTQSEVFSAPANGFTNATIDVVIAASFNSSTKTAVLTIKPLG